MIIFIVVATCVYLYMINFKLQKKSVYFFTGLLIFFLAVASPLHFIGMHYLFSAHMVTHIMILLIAAPLLVLGIPRDNKFKGFLLLFSKKIYTASFISWFIGVAIMWFWHIPYIFNLMFAGQQQMGAMHSMSLVSLLHVFTLLLAGILFSWPIINPYKNYRLNALYGVLYLSTACVFCSLLGLLLTFAPFGTYSHYLFINDPYGYLSLIRNQWGISGKMDEQIAGMIMWVPCCFIYLTGAMILLKKWFDEKEIAPVSIQINLSK